MMKQNYEITVWRNGENLRGDQDAILAFCKMSESLDLRYDRLVGLALLMQSSISKIEHENHPLYHHTTHGANKLTEIAIGDTGNDKITETTYDPEKKSFRMLVNPKNIMTFWTKDLHLDPNAKEGIVGFFMTQEMAKIRQEQKVPQIRNSHILSTQAMREADSTAVALMTLRHFSGSVKAFEFLQKHYLTGMGDLTNLPYFKTQETKLGRDLSTKALLALEKKYRADKKTWLGYAPSLIKATQYPDIYQNATSRLSMIARYTGRQ